MVNHVHLYSGHGQKRTCWCQQERPQWRRLMAAWGYGTSAATWWGCTGASLLHTTGLISNAERHRSSSTCSVSVKQITFIQDLNNIQQHCLDQAAEVLLLRELVPSVAVEFGVINPDLLGLLSNTITAACSLLLTSDSIIWNFNDPLAKVAANSVVVVTSAERQIHYKWKSNNKHIQWKYGTLELEFMQ